MMALGAMNQHYRRDYNQRLKECTAPPVQPRRGRIPGVRGAIQDARTASKATGVVFRAYGRAVAAKGAARVDALMGHLPDDQAAPGEAELEYVSIVDELHLEPHAR